MKRTTEHGQAVITSVTQWVGVAQEGGHFGSEGPSKKGLGGTAPTPAHSYLSPRGLPSTASEPRPPGPRANAVSSAFQMAPAETTSPGALLSPSTGCAATSSTASGAARRAPQPTCEPRRWGPLPRAENTRCCISSPHQPCREHGKQPRRTEVGEGELCLAV